MDGSNEERGDSVVRAVLAVGRGKLGLLGGNEGITPRISPRKAVVAGSNAIGTVDGR
jgi:hypothetical protein